MHRPPSLIAFGFAVLTGAAEAEPLPVHIVKAELALPMAEAVLTGTLQAIEAFAVSFPQGGRVIAVLVQEGDRVSKGQDLARVDPTQADAALRAAVAGLGGADAALREAQQASDRAQELLSRGAGTRADVDTATRSLLAAQSSSDQAAAHLSKARTAQDNTVLRAPRAGIVTARAAEPGQVVNPGQKVLEMAAEGGSAQGGMGELAGGLEGVFYAPDGVDLEAFLGSPVTLTPVDQVGVRLAGTITEVSPLVDATTGTVMVKARLDGAVPAGIVFGTPVVGHLTLPQQPAITLPWTALTAQDGKPAVWTVNPATLAATQTRVTVAVYGTDIVRLSGGISPGTLVVTDGAQLLFSGRVVVPVVAGRVVVVPVTEGN